MAVRATELRKGTVIVGERGQLLLITEYHHHTPGNLRAVIHMKVKNIQSGQTTRPQVALALADSPEFHSALVDQF